MSMFTAEGAGFDAVQDCRGDQRGENTGNYHNPTRQRGIYGNTGRTRQLYPSLTSRVVMAAISQFRSRRLRLGGIRLRSEPCRFGTSVQARFSYSRVPSGRFCRFAEFEDPDCIDLNDYADDTIDGRFDAGHARRN